MVGDDEGEVGRNRPWQALDVLPGHLGSLPSMWRRHEMLRKGGYEVDTFQVHFRRLIQAAV